MVVPEPSSLVTGATAWIAGLFLYRIHRRAAPAGLTFDTQG
jgi:hypothetical protein